MHNTIAVVQGYRGKKTPFIRTPKFNLQGKKDQWKSVKYRRTKVKPSVYGELFLALYFISGIVLAVHFRDFSIIPFLVMQAFGFAAVGIASFRHALAR